MGISPNSISQKITPSGVQAMTACLQVFQFDPRTIVWSRYMENYCLGAKQFVLKEEISELPQARIALQR